MNMTGRASLLIPFSLLWVASSLFFLLYIPPADLRIPKQHFDPCQETVTLGLALQDRVAPWFHRFPYHCPGSRWPMWCLSADLPTRGTCQNWSPCSHCSLPMSVLVFPPSCYPVKAEVIRVPSGLQCPLEHISHGWSRNVPHTLWWTPLHKMVLASGGELGS